MGRDITIIAMIFAGAAIAFGCIVIITSEIQGQYLNTLVRKYPMIKDVTSPERRELDGLLQTGLMLTSAALLIFIAIIFIGVGNHYIGTR